jgi:poly-gamma-glutamate synthesis protein (capsule biosynthesis protein)
MSLLAAIVAIALGCRGTQPAPVPPPTIAQPRPHTAAAAVAPKPAASAATCEHGVPAAACTAFRAQATSGTLSVCAADAPARVGEWRYALVAPINSPIEDITPDAFTTVLATATTSADTQAVLGARGATYDMRPQVTAARWAIVPADELAPQWKVVTVGGHHPLGDAGGPLTIALCATAKAHVANIDPGELTTVAMTGVTAMARYTAALMDRKGTTYPARDVATWFEHTDFVHVSNEVSFVPTCDPKPDTRQQPFCSRESYIELLEAIHANIIELDGSHLSDFGWKWLTHTIEMYEARHWQFFGGGRTQLEATRPLLVEHAGTKLAFIGCNMPHSTSHTIRNGPNVGYCDLARLDWQVRDLRARGYAPIVSIQHEEVYTHRPPDVVVRDFRHLAAAGAAVVFGSQAHWAHPFEVVDGAYVHYGAGNFFFDQAWKGAQDATADRLYFVRGKLLTVGHLFTRLEETGRPRPMHDRERAGFLRELDAELVKLPKADPWRTPTRVAPPPAIPDSFLIGNEAIQLAVALPASAPHACVIDLHRASKPPGDAIAVTLRRTPKAASGPALGNAIADFIATKYAIARDRVTVR